MNYFDEMRFHFAKAREYIDRAEAMLELEGCTVYENLLAAEGEVQQAKQAYIAD